MNIVSLVLRNVTRGPQSHRFPDRPVPAPGYRGPIVVDPALCMTCGICETVCVSAAIEVRPGEQPGAASGTWSYDLGRCCFCGACIRHCPTSALHNEPDRGLPYRPGDRTLTSQITYPPCTACGRPTLPHTPAVINKALSHTADVLTERAGLCPDCRQRATVAAMKKYQRGTHER